MSAGRSARRGCCYGPCGPSAHAGSRQRGCRVARQLPPRPSDASPTAQRLPRTAPPVTGRLRSSPYPLPRPPASRPGRSPSRHMRQPPLAPPAGLTARARPSEARPDRRAANPKTDRAYPSTGCSSCLRSPPAAGVRCRCRPWLKYALCSNRPFGLRIPGRIRPACRGPEDGRKCISARSPHRRHTAFTRTLPECIRLGRAAPGHAMPWQAALVYRTRPTS
jgi:hypothetical protein